MSMLAERKVKQKWSLNPRGKAWSEDGNKFGQRILEKMGWSPGKGLGAKEDGVKEHIKISYKNDNKGMGYKGNDDNWLDHHVGFNALLESLSGDHSKNDEETKISSLEQKSQNSKVRLHYKKFTRGKDLSRCTEKDLACIFGKKTLEQSSPVPENQDEKVEERQTSSFIINGGSMLDYFKKKLPNYAKKLSVVNHKELDSEEETSYVGFGFKNNSDSEDRKRRGDFDENSCTPKKIKLENNDMGVSNPAFDPLSGHVSVEKHVLRPIQEENEDVSREESEIVEQRNGILNENDYKIKSKKKKTTFDNLSTTVNSVNEIQELKRKKKKKKSDNQAGNEESTKFEVKRKKKKNDSPPVVEDTVSLTVDNPAFDELSSDSTVNINNKFEVKRKKKKNGNLIVENAIESSNAGAINGDCSPVDNSFQHPEKIKRKKKRDNDSLAIDNPVFDDLSNDSSVNPSNKFEVKRKKRKREDDEVNCSVETNVIDNDCQVIDISVNSDKVKRKKKKGVDNLAIDNPVFDDLSNDSAASTNSKFEVQRKKKRKADISAVDNDLSKEKRDDTVETDSSNKIKQKKKKDSFAIDNPVFNDLSNDSSVSVNDKFEIKRKKKKTDNLSNDIDNVQSKVKAIDNPAFNDLSNNSPVNVSTKFEVKRKNKKNKNSLATDNPSFDQSLDGSSVKQKKKKDKTPSVDDQSNNSINATPVIGDEGDVTFDLMLNVTSTPTLPKANSTTLSSQTGSTVKRRKSVRFSDVNQEHIIPNRHELDRDIEEMAKKIESCQAEVENDLNEVKEFYIGETGNPEGDNEQLPEGTKLKFKFASFGKSPFWSNKGSLKDPKTSYKDIIKGDIILGFKNTNLHAITGYGIRNNVD